VIDQAVGNVVVACWTSSMLWLFAAVATVAAVLMSLMDQMELQLLIKGLQKTKTDNSS